MELNLDLYPDLFERLAVFVPCNPWCLVAVVGLLILNLFIRKFFGNSLVTPYYNSCHRSVPTIYVVLTSHYRYCALYWEFFLSTLKFLDQILWAKPICALFLYRDIKNKE